jgi:tetratricopeptide (TPR) repeat protein/O-antigen ligase
MPPPADSRAQLGGRWLLAFLVPASALALGSVPTVALIVMSSLAALACALLWMGDDVTTSRGSRWMMVALAVLLGVTVLQAVPLPSWLTHALAPAGADIWDRALSPLREPGPAWHPLSVAPPATRVEILRGFFYGCVFLGALRVAALEHGERFLVRLVVFSAVAMALSALAHNAVGAQKVFGVYRPRELHAYAPGHYAPLLNTNHLAAYLNIGACVSLGALLSRRNIPRALSGSAMLVLVAMSIWQGSRGATGTLLFGLVLTFVLTLYAKRRFDSARAGGLILAACALAATLIVTVTLSEASRHLLSLETQKVDVAKRSLGLVAASPWVGFGRGAFETVFSSVRQGSDWATWTNPEDIVIQWLVEWGVPATLGGVVLLGWALRPHLILRAVRPAVGAWVAVVATVLHDLVDYHLEVPGIVALAAVCAALVVSVRPTSRGPGERASGERFSLRVWALALAGCSVVAVVVVVPDVGHTLAEERRSLGANALDRSLSAERFEIDIREAMLRYPAEPFLPLMGAVRAQAIEGTSVIPWVGRALERNPRFGRAHLVLARSLAVGHAAQSRLEYRLAYEYDETLRDTIAREILPVIDGPTAALELVPEGPAGVAMLDALVLALAPRLPSTAVILDAELERRAPASLAPVKRRVEAEVMDATLGAPWCEGSAKCLASARVAAEELVRREPGRCGAHVLLARVRARQGEVPAALDGLEHAVPLVSDRAECQRQLITLAMESGQARRGDLALEQLERAGCGAAAECLDLYVWAGSMEESRGHYARAVRIYKRLLDLRPDRDDILERIGQLGDKDGQLTDALEAYRTLSLRHPSEARYPARIAELRARAQRRPAMPGMPGLPVAPPSPGP